MSTGYQQQEIQRKRKNHLSKQHQQLNQHISQSASGNNKVEAIQNSFFEQIQNQNQNQNQNLNQSLKQEQQQQYSGSQRKYRQNPSMSSKQQSRNNSSAKKTGNFNQSQNLNQQQQQQQSFQLSNQSFQFQDLNENYMKLREKALEFINKGQIDAAFNLFQQSIEEAAQSFEESSFKFQSFFKQTIQLICNLSMQLLGQRNLEGSLQILFKTEEFVTDSRFSGIDSNLNVLILNNIGCVYKRDDDKLNDSLKYLQKAESLMHEFHCYENAGITYLNLGAVFSKMKQYEDSLQVTKRAHEYFQNEINELKSQKQIDQKQVNQKARHLAIASLNIGTDYEIIGNLEEAVKNYEYGQQIILPMSNINDPLNVRFKQCIAKCRAKQTVNMHKGSRTMINNNQPKQLFRPYSGKQIKSQSELPQVKNSQYPDFSPSIKNDKFNKTMQNPINNENQSHSKKKAPKILRQNYFSENEDNFESSFNNYKKNNQKNRNINKNNANFLSNNQSNNYGRKSIKGLQSSIENSQEIGSDLEKMGVLDWKDSDNESQEDELDKTKRLNFLQSMNNYDNGIKTQKLYKPPLFQDGDDDDDLHENPFKPTIQKRQSNTSDFKSKEYDEYRIKRVQKIYKEMKRRKQLAKSIREQQQKKKSEYLQNIQREKDLQVQQYYDNKVERLRQQEKENRLQEEQLEKKEEKAIFLQKFYRKKKEEWEIRNQTRERAQKELNRREQIQREKSAIVIQSNFRMFKEKNNYQLLNILGKNGKKKDTFKTKLIKKQKAGVKYIEKSPFQEWEKCQILYCNLTVYLQEKILTQEETEAYANIRKTSYNQSQLSQSQCDQSQYQNQNQFPNFHNQSQQSQYFSNNNNQSQQKGQQHLNTEQSQYDSVMSSDQDVYQSFLVLKAIFVKGQNISENLKQKKKVQQCVIPIRAQIDKQFKFVMKDLNCFGLNLNIQQNLIFFIDQLLQLLYVNSKGQLHIYDITDIDKIEKLSNNKIKNPTMLSMGGNYYDQAARTIQKFVRGAIVREKHEIQKNDRQIHLYRIWNLRISSEGLNEAIVRCYLYHDQQQGMRIAAKNMQTNTYFTQRLEWSNKLMDEYPKATNEEILELIDFNPKLHSMEFSEIAGNVLGRAQQKAKLRKLREIDENLIIKVQSRFRRKMAMENYLAVKDRLKEINQQKKDEKFVTQRLIFDENETFILRLFYLEDGDKKLIKINCIHMTRIKNLQIYIPPYYQEMFPKFQENYLLFFGAALLEKAFIKKSRKDQQKKIGVPRIEEIMADIKIQIKKQKGHKIDFQNSTLDARKIFNSMRLRMVYQQNDSLINQLNIKNEQSSVFEFQEGEQYAKLIQDLYKKYTKKKRENIEKTKVISENESLKDMAINFRSEKYQFPELEKRDAIEKRVKQEGEVVKPIQQGDKILEDYEYNYPILRKDMLSQLQIGSQKLIGQESELKKEQSIIQQQQLISQNSQLQTRQQIMLEGINEKWLFDAYVQRLSNLLIIVGLRTYGEDERKEVVTTQIGLQQLELNDAKNPQAQKKYVVEKILDNLRFKEGHKDYETNQQISSVLYYKEPSEDELMKKMKEEKSEKQQILSSYEQLQKEIRQDQSSLVQLQTYQNGNFQVTYEIQLKTMIILCTISHKQDIRIKTDIFYSIDLFQCPPIKDMISLKNTYELHRLFNNILKQMTQNLELKIVKRNGEQKIRHNGNHVKQMMPDILRNVFALRLQNTIKTFRLKKIFRQVKNFLKSQEFFLFNKVQKNKSQFFKLSFFLLRNDYKLKLIVERHPTRSSKQFQTGYEISLLKIKQQFDLSSKDTLLQIQKMRDRYKKMQQEEKNSFTQKKMSEELDTGDEMYLKQQFDYLKISDEEWDEILRQNRKANFKQDPTYLTQNRWMEIQGIHSLVYYRNIYRDLVNYLDENITFIQTYDKIVPQVKDKRIQLESIKLKEKEVIKKKKKNVNLKVEQQFLEQQRAGMAIYRAYQKIKVHEDKNLRKQAQEQRQQQIKQIGLRVKRAFKQIGTQRYIVNIYKKDNVYTFHLINVLREKKRQNKREGPVRVLKAVYQFDNNKLLNTKEKTIEDFLLDQLDMKEPETKNIYDSENNVIGRQKMGDDEGELFFKDFAYQGYNDQKDQNTIDQEEQDYNIMSIQKIKSEQNIPQNRNQSLSKELNEQNMGEGVPSNIASNLVDYVHEKDEDGRETVYNVVYTGKRPKDIQEKRKQLLLQKGNGQTVKIDVDLGELKKLYPTLNLKSQELMKFIGEQLIEGIKVDQNGKIILDSNKINPHCINITENLMGDEENFQEEEENDYSDEEEFKKQQEDKKQLQEILEKKQKEELEKKLQVQSQLKDGKMGLGGFKQLIRPKAPSRQISQKSEKEQIQSKNYSNESKVILLRDTRFFNQIKYLVRVYLIERQVNKIISSSKDQVFQEYETCYQVDSMNLTDKKQQNLTWEITPLEVAEISSGIIDKNEAARYLLKRLQIYNNQYILIVDEKVHANRIKPSSNLVVFYAKGIQPIQIHFKNRTYRKNYHIFETEMKQKKQDVIWKGVPQELKTIKSSYLLVCFQKNKVKKLEFVAFDLLNFQRFFCELDRNQFARFLNVDKQETISVLSKFFDIDTSKQQLYINEGAVKEYLEKHFKDLFNQKLISSKSVKSNSAVKKEEDY